MNNNGQMIMLQLLFLFMTIVITVAMLPAINSILGVGQNSENLNCTGYNDTDTPSLSYNSSLNTNKTACLALDLYLPYILLVVLIGSVSKLLMPSGGRSPYEV